MPRLGDFRLGTGSGGGGGGGSDTIYTFVSEGTSDGSSPLIATGMDDTYDEYLLVYSEVISNNSLYSLQVDNGAGGWVTAANSYAWSIESGAGSLASTGDTRLVMCRETSGLDDAGTGFLQVFDPANASKPTRWIWEFTIHSDTTDECHMAYGCGLRRANESREQARIVTSSNGNVSGVVKVFGVTRPTE